MTPMTPPSGNLKLTDQRTSYLPLGASKNIRFPQQVEVHSESSSPDTTSDVAAGIFYWGINAPDQVIMLVVMVIWYIFLYQELFIGNIRSSFIIRDCMRHKSCDRIH